MRLSRTTRPISSAYGVDLAQVRKGHITEHGSIIAMDPPAHRRMRGLLNKVFTPRAIEALRPLVAQVVDKHLSVVDPDGFDFVQDFSALFPVDLMTTLQGVPEQDRQQIRLWIDDLLHRAPGEVEMSEAGMKSAVDMAIYYYRLTKQRRENLGDDLLSKLIESEIEHDNGEMTPLSNIEITEFATLLGGAGAETVTKLLGSAAVVFARNPDQWRKLLDDRGKIPARCRGIAALRGALAVQRAPLDSGDHVARRNDSGGQTCVLVRRFGQSGSVGVDRSRHLRHRPRPHAGAESRSRLRHPQLPGRGSGAPGEHVALDRMLDFMPRYEVDFAACKRVNMQNVAGWSNVPVRVLR